MDSIEGPRVCQGPRQEGLPFNWRQNARKQPAEQQPFPFDMLASALCGISDDKAEHVTIDGLAAQHYGELLKQLIVRAGDFDVLLLETSEASEYFALAFVPAL
jgi:hypothetical protein